MVSIVGLLFWLLALLALVRIITPLLRNSMPRPAYIAGWALLLLLASLLLLRPHEDIFGGEDPGAYLNAAASFSRHNTLFHSDPLLSRLAPADRTSFFYGHSGFATTKDACLWMRSQHNALVGPWFQPAFSIMLSTLTRLTPIASLYGAPLLGLMTAIVLACLAARLIARPWAAPITFLLYTLSPVVVWNARAPRAEMGAVFFLFSAWALLLPVQGRHRDRVSLDLILALACLAIAPLFHITAYYGVLAAFAALLVMALRGRRDFLLAIPAALLSIAAMGIQSYHITDCYGLKPYFQLLPRHAWTLALVAALGTGICIWLSFRNHAAPLPSAPRRRWSILLLAFGVPLLAIAIAILRDDAGHVPLLPAWVNRYFILTDIRGLVRLFSLPAALAALAGWILLAWPSTTTPTPSSRWTFLAAITPGILMTGWMDNYMMETRRMMIVPAPMMALCMAAFIAACASAAQRFRWKPAAPVIAILLTAALLGTMAAPRSILYRTTEYRGFFRYLKPFAEEIRRHNGILLGEYSRVAAPFEHFFGITLLALDSDRRTDYRLAEKAWQDITRQLPDRPAYFLSPYANPVSTFFDFTPVMQQPYTGDKLPGSKDAIPEAARRFEITLHLFRMTPKGTVPPPTSFIRTFDGGNMGLRNFANLSTKPLRITGYPLPQTNALIVTFPPTSNTLSLFVHAPASPSLILRTQDDSAVSFTGIPLTEGWWVLETAMLPSQTAELRLSSGTGEVFLCNILMREGTVIHPVAFTTTTPAVIRPLPPHATRWARNDASLLVPVTKGTLSTAYCLMTLNPEQPVGSYVMKTGIDDGNATFCLTQQDLALIPGEWAWRAIPVSGGSNNLARLSFHAATPWDPTLRGFPNDLAVQVGTVVVRSL
jgi:hypothetical protein